MGRGAAEWSRVVRARLTRARARKRADPRTHRSWYMYSLLDRNELAVTAKSALANWIVL